MAKRKVKKRKPLPKAYKAPPGSKRAALLRKAEKLYKSGNKQAAFKLRERMEEKERAKKNFKTKKAKYSQKETSKKTKRNGNTKKKGRKK